MTLRDYQLFDAHLHIIDPRFPLIANQGYLPAPFTVADYRTRTADYHLVGGAIVSGSFQAFDQSYLRAALAELGPSFVGVTQLPSTASDAEIVDLHRAGVRALRFNLKRGGSAEVGDLEALALRVHALVGWHVELYVDSRDLGELVPLLTRLPAVSIDHLGLSREGLPALLQLVAAGVRVKATGFGRVDFSVATALQELCAVNPDALLFGTDLPSTRAARPYGDVDFLLVVEALGEELARKVLCTNALNFYRHI
ncbi:MAG: amidohydrolase family protein [Desulfuromonadales bacterium]|nr:amidohydrolase family protein [Desulfuromonadales bacterium]